MIIVCQILVQLYLNKITLKDGKEGKQNRSESVVFILSYTCRMGIIYINWLYQQQPCCTETIYYELILFNTNYNFDMYCEYDVYYHVTHLDVNMKERTLVLVFIDISIITGNTYCNLENIASTQATFTGKFCYFAVCCFESITHSIIII